MSTAIYCTYLTVYYGNKLPSRYIGSTSLVKISNGYNGSVTSTKYKDIFLKEQRNNKHLFKTRILSIHATRKEAFEEELRLQIKYDVVKSNRYINMSLAQSNGYFGGSGTDNGMYGQGDKLRGEKNGMFGVKRPNEWCKQHSSFMRGNKHAVGANWSEEARKKKSEQMKKVIKPRASCVECHKELTIQNLDRHYATHFKKIH